MFPFGVSLVVYRPGAASWNGDKAPGSTHVTTGCALWQNSSDEITQQRDTTITTYTVLAPRGADITTADLVWLPGDDPAKPARWQVNGDPAPFDSPFTGWRPGIEVQLKRVAG